MEMHALLKTVFVVEDSLAVRARLLEMLGDIDNVSIVGTADSAMIAARRILETHPDFVVLDFQLDGGTGVDVLHAVRAQVPETFFIVITNHPQLQVRRICMAAGADAFFDKTTEFQKVRDVIAAARPN